MSDNTFFNRVCKLTVGPAAPSGSVDLNFGLSFENPMRITFDIKKTSFSVANQATITINNLSDKSRRFITKAWSNNIPVVAQLEAGYKEYLGLQLIFIGEIVDVSHNVTKPEIITTITAQDGHSAIKTKRISASWKDSTPIISIIQDAVKKMGLPINSVYDYSQIAPTLTTVGSYSFCGNASDLIDKICNDNGLQWSVQNGKIKIFNDGKTDGNPSLEAEIIGSPRRLYKNYINISLNDFSGYEFDALLMPKCEPGSSVKITSNELSGGIGKPPIYWTGAAMEVEHKGDLYGEHWMTTVRARDL